MANEPMALEALAQAVADGAAVDWAEVERSLDSDSDRSAIRALRALAQVVGATAEHVAGATVEQTAGATDEPRATWGSLALRGELGAGSFGRVYRAWDDTLEREVALKLIPRDPSDPDATRLLQEARLLARIEHPNIVTVFGADASGGSVGIWMELVTGRTLKDLVSDIGRFGAHEAALIGRDLCGPLAAMHAAGFLHRDLKAQNVMREQGGRTVLMDFGAGTSMAPGAGSVARGTPAYLAPEIFAHQPATVASDLYSLGVLLYYLVTASFPVGGASFSEIAAEHAANRRRLLADVRPDLPRAFVRLVDRLTDPDPLARPASAGAVANDLDAALAEQRERTGPLPKGSRSPLTEWFSHRVAAALTVLALIVVVGTVFWRIRYLDATSTAALAGPDEITLDLYRRGQEQRSLRTNASTALARQLFSEAIARDSQFAPAYAGLADAYTISGVYGYLPRLEAFDRAAAAAEQAVSFDPTLAEAHASLGYAQKNQFKWAAAEESFKKAIALKPSYASAHQWYSVLLTQLKQFDKAKVEAITAQSNDPAGFGPVLQLASLSKMKGDYDTAIKYYEQVTTMERGVSVAYRHLATVEALRGNVGKALALFEQAKSVSGLDTEDQEMQADMAIVFAMANERARAIGIAERLAERYRRNGEEVTGNVAAIYSAVNDVERAFEWLELARTRRDPELGYLKVDPRWTNLHRDPRYTKLLIELGLESR